MSPMTDDAAATSHPTLEELSWRVRDARARVQSLRGAKGGAPVLADARHRLLVALEAYVKALEHRRFPVPPTLHAELELHRKLFF